MRKHLQKFTSFKSYIAFLRRQPKHVQHVYAAIFAGGITTLIAVIILYVDYGFWRERYLREDVVIVSTTTAVVSNTDNYIDPESPSKMFSRFFGEAGNRLKNISTSPQNLLKGKESYMNTDSDN